MAICCLWKINTWLTYAQQGGVQVQLLRRWEHSGRADECYKHAPPELQRYPSSQLTLLFTGGRHLCPPEKPVPRHGGTNRRAGFQGSVSLTHRQLVSRSWHCFARTRWAEGHQARSQKMVSTDQIPQHRVPGRTSLADSEPVGLPCLALVCSGFARAQHVRLQPQGLQGAHKAMLCWRKETG